MATTDHTHTAKGATFGFECTPVASHLNRDGTGNGITRVERTNAKGKAETTDVGTRTLHKR